jgi:hypothetical protein
MPAELIDRRSKSCRKLPGGANAPVVQEIYCGLPADHVVVNRNNVESVAAQRLQYPALPRRPASRRISCAMIEAAQARAAAIPLSIVMRLPLL